VFGIMQIIGKRRYRSEKGKVDHRALRLKGEQKGSERLLESNEGQRIN
jgi:hypothetical protein